MPCICTKCAAPQVCSWYWYVVTVVTLTCYCCCCYAATAAADAARCCWCSVLVLLYMAAAAAAAPAAQYCCSTTKRMPRYYYCVREAHTLISLAEPPFGLRAFYTHTRTMVGCTLLAVVWPHKIHLRREILYIYVYTQHVSPGSWAISGYCCRWYAFLCTRCCVLVSSCWIRRYPLLFLIAVLSVRCCGFWPDSAHSLAA